MQKITKILIGTGILAVIVLAGILVGWLGGRTTSPPTPPTPPLQSTERNPATPATPAHSSPIQAVITTNPAVTTQAQAASSLAATNLSTQWEDKIDEILGNDEDDTNKVKQLFALFPSLPEDGQSEAAQHLSNLVDDDAYAPLGELLKNGKLPEDVLDTLMADLLNRPNAIKLPMFLELARNPSHPKAEESKDMLELYLDEDYGTDWKLWQQKMQEWLKDNPD